MRKRWLVSLAAGVTAVWGMTARAEGAGRPLRVGIDAWRGARVAFLGDSITDPGHVGCTTNYWGYLSEDLGFDAKVFGVSGHQWSHIPGQIDRLHAAMPEGPDAIFVFVGTNDYMGGVPLGETFDLADGETNLRGRKTVLPRRSFSRNPNTYRGRMNIALERLKTEFPESQIVVLTPIHRAFFTCSETNVQPPECFANALGLFVDEYVEATKEVARHWSVPVIDLFAESGLTPLNDSYVRYFANGERDRLHPNNAGHRRIADLVEAKLNALPATFRR